MAWFRCGSVKQEPYIYNVYNAGFNTGYTHTANTKVVFKAFVDPYTAAYTQIFGARSGNYSSHAFGFFGTFNSGNYCFYRTGQEAAGDGILAAESSTSAPWYETCVFTAYQQTLFWYREFDSNTVRSITASSSIVDDGVAPLGIFCVNNASASGDWSPGDYGSRMKLYWFEIYESDVLVHRFVPAYHNSQYCLYDEVDENYIYNSVTGGEYIRGFGIT